MIKNFKKNKGKIGVLLIILLAILTIFVVRNEIVKAETIKEYEARISMNTSQIEAIDQIKLKLHETAELLRNHSYINSNFDIALSQKWHECNDYQITKNNENADLMNKIASLKTNPFNKSLIGYFTLTHYCPCSKCNGSYGNKTAIGTTLTPYRTIAVDRRIIKLGSKVQIQGKTYIAEDTGSAIKGNKIDVCVSNHSEAMALGVKRNVPVYLIK